MAFGWGVWLVPMFALQGREACCVSLSLLHADKKTPLALWKSCSFQPTWREMDRSQMPCIPIKAPLTRALNRSVYSFKGQLWFKELAPDKRNQVPMAIGRGNQSHSHIPRVPRNSITQFSKSCPHHKVADPNRCGETSLSVCPCVSEGKGARASWMTQELRRL